MTKYDLPDHWNRTKHVSFGELRRALEGATLRERARILTFVRKNPKRIRPSLEDDWLYDTMSAYLLDYIAHQCESQDDSSPLHTPFEAAHDLVDWFGWIVAREANPSATQNRVRKITDAFKNGTDSIRNCIETGFLEHALEVPRNRQYFQHWKDDPDLVESYTEALRWGELHAKPDAP